MPTRDTVPESMIIRKQHLLPKNMTAGTWDWRSMENIEFNQLAEEFRTLHTLGINVIYLDASAYIDYVENPNRAAAEQQLKKFEEALKSYVALANVSAIKVQILAGNTAWGLSSHAYIQQKFVDFVQLYNRAVQPNQQLDGLQFDIEVHNDPAYLADKKGTLQQYLNSVAETVKHYKQINANYRLGYTMPYWYDNENNNLPDILYNGRTIPVGYHIFDLLNPIGAYTVLMDYRNFTETSDGSIQHAQNEILYTSRYTPNVAVIIGQETTNTPETKISFYSKNYADLVIAINQLALSFEKYQSFSGYAVHDLSGLLNLKQKPN